MKMFSYISRTISSVLVMSGLLLIFTLTISAQKLGPLDPLSLSWLETQVKAGKPTLVDYDAYLFKLICRRGGGIEPTKNDIERLIKQGAGKKVLSFLQYRVERKANSRVLNPCRITNIVLADFYNIDTASNAEKHPEVTSEIRKELINLTTQFADVNVISLKAPITEADRGEVTKAGKQYDATIVIWGNFTKVENATKINAWIEVLSNELPVTPTLEVKQEGDGFKSLRIQGDMAHDLKTMMLMTMGALSSHIFEPTVTLSYFSSVLDQPKVSPVTRFYANSWWVKVKWYSKLHFSRAEQEEMISHLEAALAIDPASSKVQLQMMLLYSKIDSAKAIEHGNNAVKFAKSTDEKISAYMRLAQFYDDISDWENLRSTTKEVIDLLRAQKQDLGVKMGLIKVYRMLGDEKDAEMETRNTIDMIAADKQSDASNYLTKGLLEVFLHRDEEMVKSITKALEIKPDLIPANVMLGLHYWGLGNREKDAKRLLEASAYYQKGLDFIDKALKSDSTYVEAILGKAQIYNSMDKVQEAAAEYKRVLAIDPNFKMANLALSNLYAQRKDFKIAIDYISASIEAKADPAFYTQRAKYYLDSGKDDLALADIMKCHELLAADLSKWVEKKGNQVDLYNLLDIIAIYNKQVVMLTDHKNFRSAATLCDKFIKLYGDFDFMHQKKASFLRDEAELRPEGLRDVILQEALTEADKSVSMNAKNVKNYETRSLILLDLKKYQRVRDDADKAIILSPLTPKNYYIRAYANWSDNKYEDSVKDVEAGLVLEKDEQEKEKMRLFVIKLKDEIKKRAEEKGK